MSRNRARPAPPPAWTDDDTGEFSPATGPSPVDWILLVLRAAWRRKWIAVVVFLVGMGGSALYYRSRTPLYRAEAKIFTQRGQSLPSAVRPGAPDDAPTRSAWDIVHRRENLISLVKETNILPAAPEPGLKTGAGSGIGSWLQQLLGVSVDPLSEGDATDALVGRLNKALEVTTEEGTITVAIYWPDPQQAFRLVEGAVQNFLEARHLQEVSAIDEVISLLQGRAATLREQLDRVVAEDRRDSTRDLGRPLAGSSSPSLAIPQSEELVRIQSMLEAKRRAIADVEEFRRRRLADLQAQLDAQRAVYAEAHPSLINLRGDIEALSRESPQVAGLREEEARLRKEYQIRLAQEPRARQALAPSPHGATSAPTSIGTPSLESERVRNARLQYQQMIDRVTAGQISLDTARAAFKYRYNVIWPPEVPKTPSSPRPGKILGLGALASLLLSILAAAWPDLKSGRIMERWQVERSLDLPILGELSVK